MKPNTICLRFK